MWVYEYKCDIRADNGMSVSSSSSSYSYRLVRMAGETSSKWRLPVGVFFRDARYVHVDE